MEKVRSRWRLSLWLPGVAAIGIAVGVKHYYRHALCEDLLWILRPTARVVEVLTGLPFVYDPSFGYVNAEKAIAIAPECSGVNFLVIALLMSFFSFFRYFSTAPSRWLWLLVSLGGAFVLTLAVNSLRIGLSVLTLLNDVQAGWLTAARIHRLEGVFVYFASLVVYYLAIKVVLDRGRQGQKSGRQRRTLLALIPLGWYLLVAVVVPILTGNYRGPEDRFFEHVLVVVTACTTITMLLQGAAMLFRRARQRCRQMEEQTWAAKY